MPLCLPCFFFRLLVRSPEGIFDEVICKAGDLLLSGSKLCLCTGAEKQQLRQQTSLLGTLVYLAPESTGDVIEGCPGI